LQSVDRGPYDDIDVGGADTRDQNARGDGETMHGGVHVDAFMQPIRRRARTGTRKGRQKQAKQPRSPRRGKGASRPARNPTSPTSLNTEHAENDNDEEAGQASTSTVPTAPIEADEQVEDHVCKDCGTTSTPQWRLQVDESWLCNSCHLYFRKHKRHKGNVREEDRRRNREARSVGPVQ